jgi:biopolymer transport protein ExbD
MAINVGSAGGGRRSRGLPAMAEINVTPFVDVALVLLIIFMITAHAMESGIDVDVPKTKTVATTTKEQPIVTINKAGELYLGKSPVNINDLVSEIHTRYPGQNAVYIRADKETTMEIAVAVMDELGHAKLGLSIVTQLDDSSSRRR